VIAAKTADSDPRLEGTIYTAAAAIEAAGGKALPLVVDIRNEERVKPLLPRPLGCSVVSTPW
jgi:citronellol/citronellal dehydrogenase